MTLLAIILGIALAGLAAALVTVSLWLRSSQREATAAAKLYQDQRGVTAEEVALKERAVRERDVAIAQLAAEKVRHALTWTQLSDVAAQRNRALKEKVERVREVIKASPPADAARIVDELLAAPLPRMSQDAPTTADGAGASGAADVPATGASGPGSARRDP